MVRATGAREDDGGVARGAAPPADVRPDDGARFRAIFDDSAIGICVVDREDRVVESNRALQHLLGYSADELRERTIASLAPGGDDDDAGHEAVRDLRAGLRERATIERRLARRDGAVLWASMTLSRVATLAGGALVALVHDVTERKELEARLRHQAFHDALTGLANRALFRDRVEHALARGGRGGHVAVLVLDLHDFKTVNDRLGHAEADRLLQVVAARLRRVMRAHDSIARLGGDEFALLLEDLAEPGDAVRVLSRVRVAIEAPTRLVRRDVSVRVRIGLAHARPGDTADDVMRNADVALHRAKTDERARSAVFEPAMHAAILERLALEDDLRRAVERSEFQLAYQPLVALATGAVVGLEALLRWNDARRGPVPPVLFIPAAERTGLIVPLGRWVLDEVCRQLQTWEQLGGPVPGISINVSGRQIEDDSFVDDVGRVLRRTGVDPSRLTFEITESTIMSRTDEILRRLEALKALGLTLAIDDFGTGYSSLSYLQRFPFDVLKVDKAFVDGVADGGSDAQLTRAIIALGAALRLRTVAEGIERPEQWGELRTLGCEVGQGYLFSRPLPPEEVAALWRGDLLRRD